MIYFDLFLTFLKIGLFTFGGGYAMISVIEGICVDLKSWITHDDMVQVTIVAESTPGPIAINCATFVGYRIGGFSGALAATFGVVLPSFVIIYCISMFLENFLEIAFIANAFRGIRLGVGFVILNAGINMMKKMKKTPLSLAILGSAVAAFLVIQIFSLRISSIALMVAAGLVSLCVARCGQKGGSR